MSDGSDDEKSQAYNKRVYDILHKRPVEYPVGQLMMIKNVVTEPGVSSSKRPGRRPFNPNSI